ncbi:MAG: IS91 family transposase [Coriobacteriia bacterium]|nr:IS91 family transposase [Coriobacteriia bacterium]
MADIVRQHGAELQVLVKLSAQQRRALKAIALCRTPALGGHLDVCRSCGHQRAAYNSCRNRHCPKCQALAQERWITARSARILPARHFHVVFTLPSQLRSLARFRPKLLYDAFFRAVGNTLLEFGQSNLRARLGVTLVLHTWTRELQLHPHLHALVTAGGLSLDDKWVRSGANYLFPVHALGKVLRGKMLDALRQLFRQGKLNGFDDFRDPEGFDRLMCKLASLNWVVYAKKPFRRADHVLRYLGRYTHRVAISNSRLLDVGPNHVTFRTKKGRRLTLHPVQFLKRFVEHILPASFVKIRHYGLYSSANVNTKLPIAHGLLTVAPPSDAAKVPTPTPQSWPEQLAALTCRDVRRCPLCGGEIMTIDLSPIHARAPP